MKYYVYFDGYGQPRQAVSERELAERYHNNTREFLYAVCHSGSNRAEPPGTGHVGILTLRDENELNEFLGSLGDEVTGFYRCESDSRPYNF